MELFIFQDSFSFILENDEMQLLEKTSHIIVHSAINPQIFVTRARTIVQINLIHLNVTKIQV